MTTLYTPHIATMKSRCPCDENLRIFVILADGERFESSLGCRAGSFMWTISGNPANTIIAWRPAK